jgi:hypothetical protein
MSLKHFIDIDALDRKALRAIIDSAAAMKRKDGCRNSSSSSEAPCSP